MIARYLERVWVQRPPKTDSPPSLTTQRREVNTGDLSLRAAAVPALPGGRECDSGEPRD